MEFFNLFSCKKKFNEIFFLMNDYLKRVDDFKSSFPKPNQGYSEERTSNQRKYIHSTSTQIKLSMKIKIKMTKKCFTKCK
jgi:hypothetical protein